MQSIISRDVLSRNNEHSMERSAIKKKTLIRLSILSIFNITCCVAFLIIVGLATLFLYVYASSTILARNSQEDPLLSDLVSCTINDLSVNCTETDLEDLLVTKDNWKFSDFFDHLHYLSDDDERDHIVIVDGNAVSTDTLELKLCKAWVNYSIDGVSQRNEITIDEFVVSYKTDDDFKPLNSSEILNIHFPGENSTAIPLQYLMFSKIMESRSCYVNPLYRNIIGFYERTIDFYYPGRSELTSLAGYLALGLLIASGGIFAFFVIPLTIVSIKKFYSYKSDIETMEHMEMNDQEESQSDSDSGSQVSNDRRYF